MKKRFVSTLNTFKHTFSFCSTFGRFGTSKNVDRSSLRFLFLLSFSFTLTFSSFAQQTTFYGPHQLGSSMITSITQTPDGLLWVGTESGLIRFDGYRFIINRSLGAAEADRPTEVTTLFVDDEARLWVGTARGLYLHDRAENRFRTVTFADSLKLRVSLLSSLPDGRVAAGTSGYGTFIVDPSTLEAVPQTGAIPTGNEAFVHGAGVSPRLRALAPHGVDLICEVIDRAGNIYIGTRGEGLYWLPKGAKAMEPMALTVSGLDLSRTRVGALFVDRQGNLWVGCQQKGLLMVALRQQTLFNTWSFAAQQRPLGTCVSALAAADGDGLWCTVQADGVYRFDGEGRIVAHSSAPQGVETLMRDSRGRYWLGTKDGLWSYNPITGAANHCASLGGDWVNEIHELADGRLAVSAFGAGMWLCDASGQAQRHFSMHDNGNVNGNGNVNDNNSSARPPVASTLRRTTTHSSTRQLVNLSTNTNKGRLANDWIFDFDTDARGRLWIATSSGVCCYDPKTDSFVTEGWEVLMDREKCTALKVLASGDVVIAGDCGVYRWSTGEGLRPEAGMEPIRGKTISSVEEDYHHDLWFGTNEGIWRWNPKERTLVAFVGASGLEAREFVPGAALTLADGRMCFGTADGVVTFHPDSLLDYNNHKVSLHLTAFVIGGEEANTLTRSNGRRVMREAVGDCHSFSLSYVDAAFRMEFSLLDFTDAEGVALEYRMNGERRWQQTQKGENTIAFNHLAPGTYHLEVRALKSGSYTPVETYVIEVRPPWWRSGLAFIIYALLLVGAAVAAGVAYRRNLRHQMDEEKLRFLMGTINTQDAPLTLDELKRAVGSFVQSRKRQHSVYGNSSTMADRMDVPEVKGNDEALMERVVQSVNRHLGDSEFSVEQLCSEAAISRAHLHRKMKEMTGLSVTEFIRNIRLEQAARLLREQKLNVTQVAYTVGFSNLGYFSTIFRKHFGVSPRDFVNGNDSDEKNDE